MRIFLLFLAIQFSISASGAVPREVIRWTYHEDKNADFEHILSKVNEKSGLSLEVKDFLKIEDKKLATSHFLMFAQMASGLPVKDHSIRIWKNLTTGDAIQVEALVVTEPTPQAIWKWRGAPELDSKAAYRLIRRAISNGDRRFRSVDWKDEWHRGEPVRSVKAKAKRGIHYVTISLLSRRVVEYRYVDYPQSDRHLEVDEITVPAKVYPIWEEYEGVKPNPNARILTQLKYLKKTIKDATSNPYEGLKTQKYPEEMQDPVKGLTEEGRKLGFWAMDYIAGLANGLYEKLPIHQNHFGNEVRLEGRYATVNLHPSAAEISGLTFKPKSSSIFYPIWAELPGSEEEETYEMIPGAGILGRPLKSRLEALNRIAERDPKHDVTRYINDGFDEIQVYWSITQLFDTLRSMGFTDPELSTRKFHAFLYDTDIAMRDNAYYTDDTINFTTYSPDDYNMARDNSTIWHELGHGVMDRLMGEHLTLADTGGLSEGMADFIAQLVLNDVTKGKAFEGKNQLRILNQTGFYFCNEIHDDGEAYGGAMNDLLEHQMKKNGMRGLHQVSDLTLEAMRLGRNHPGLTAVHWFERMLFADEMGHLPVRKSGEMKAALIAALGKRNFTLENKTVAKYRVMNGTEELTDESPGSRNHPIPISLANTESKSYELLLSLASAPGYAFQYPVTVKVGLRGGPLQGSIQWADESDKPFEYVLKSEEETLKFTLTALGQCDEVNRPDGSCVDFAYIQVFNDRDDTQPVAKKRFYLKVTPKP